MSAYLLCAKLCYMNHINYKTSAAAAASAPAPPRQGLRGSHGRARTYNVARRRKDIFRSDTDL